MIQPKSPGPSAQKVASFISKLQQILNDDNNNDSVCWSPDGSSFSIKNVKKFEDVLLPLYFRHSRMASFVRQLNMYGFHKVRTSSDLVVFAHEGFQRQHLENAVVVRKSQEPSHRRQNKGPSPEIEPGNSSLEPPASQ